MLIYNHQKEFVGIDESNLKTLGFSNLSQLINEANDFADLFVKTPGYIHNFKHVHWIDFVTCAESNQESKVIINVNNKNFRCNLDIRGVYLKEDPNNMGYAVNLVNLRALSQAEHEMAKKDIEQKPATKTDVLLDIVEDDYEQSSSKEENKEIAHDEFEDNDIISIDDFDIPQEPVQDAYKDDELLDLNIEDKQPAETKKETLVPLYNQVLEVGSDYVYDPKLASDELGLPLELIEEFVQDFIAQSKDFKVDLYNSLSDQNIDNVKILSHKLKGVAANLRIEDAYEVLSTVNSSEDLLEIEQNLNMFYEMVDKLSNEKDFKEEIPTQEEPQIASDEDDMFLIPEDEPELKEESPIEIQNSEIPQKIEMPELADDDFINLDLEDDAIELDEEFFEDKEEEINKPEFEESKEEIETKKELQYDKVKVANEIGIDVENFNELLVDFMDEAKDYVLEIQKATAKSDFEASKNSCIKLKKMCETMRIDSLDEELNTIMGTQELSIVEQALASIDTKLNLISNMEA